jgi:cbb3-type cytochrome oxidase maturation protein
MTIIFFLIGASTIVAVIFLAAFVWAMRTGQFDDDRSPAVRILGEVPLRKKIVQEDVPLDKVTVSKATVPLLP